MSSHHTSLTLARQALDRLRSTLPITTVVAVEQRLAGWERHLNQQERPPVSMPELVMRPGLPPRPLNKHYFTVVRSYE